MSDICSSILESLFSYVYVRSLNHIHQMLINLSGRDSCIKYTDFINTNIYTIYVVLRKFNTKNYNIYVQYGKNVICPIDCPFPSSCFSKLNSIDTKAKNMK